MSDGSTIVQLKPIHFSPIFIQEFLQLLDGRRVEGLFDLSYGTIYGTCLATLDIMFEKGYLIFLFFTARLGFLLRVISNLYHYVPVHFLLSQHLLFTCHLLNTCRTVMFPQRLSSLKLNYVANSSVVELKIFLPAPAPRSRKSEMRLRLQLWIV
jgi:hypothetical protein